MCDVIPSGVSTDQGRTWSPLCPIEQPETAEDCAAYGVKHSESDARQSHDG